MNCSSCGKEIPAEAKFCKYCGTQTSINEPVSVEVSTPLKKQSKLKNVLLFVLLFVAVAETVFIVLSFSVFSGRKVSDGSDTPSSSSTNQTTVDTKKQINTFGGTVTVPNDLNYEYHLGKMLIEKPNTWNALVVGVGMPITVYKAQIEDIKSKIISSGYKVDSAKTESILETERIVFEVTSQGKKRLIVYTPVTGSRTIAIEMASDQEENLKEYLNELLVMFDNAESFDSNIKFRNSIFITNIMNK